MTVVAAPAGIGHGFVGVGSLLRLAVRQDRVRLAVWITSVTVMWAYASVALQALYPTAADRQVRAALMASPAAVVLTGPGYATQSYTHGAMVAGEMGLMVFVALAIMSAQTVVRHTRAEEESGRAELLRAGVAGRRAPFASAVVLVLLLNLVIAVLTGVVLTLTGLHAPDTFALGLAGAATGAFALASGTFLDSVVQMAQEMPQLDALLGGAAGASEAFVELMAKFFAIVVTGSCLAAAAGARHEESAGQLETILGSAVSRQRWLLSRWAVVLLTGVGLLVLAGVGLWAGAAAVEGPTPTLRDLLVAVGAHLPALLVFVGLAMLLTGWAPRRVQLVWGWYAFAFVASVYGGLLGLPRWTVDLSPFEHVPALAVGRAGWGGVAVLVAGSALLVAAGVAAFRRRDVPGA